LHAHYFGTLFYYSGKQINKFYYFCKSLGKDNANRTQWQIYLPIVEVQFILFKDNISSKYTQIKKRGAFHKAPRFQFSIGISFLR
ncbi:MAG: hypothetical protein J6O49_01485, partial [Bacteroidaceae bacterium]|nr:hypothetical protein [Bacteroidaceae bacterium]